MKFRTNIYWHKLKVGELYKNSIHGLCKLCSKVNTKTLDDAKTRVDGPGYYQDCVMIEICEGRYKGQKRWISAQYLEKCKTNGGFSFE